VKKRNSEEGGGSETSSFWQQQAVAFTPLSVEVESYISRVCSDRKILKIWISIYIPSTASFYKVLLSQVAISLEKGRKSLVLCENFDDW